MSAPLPLRTVLVVLVAAGVAVTAMTAAPSAEAEKKRAKDKPSLSLDASPTISFAPTEITFRARIEGGPDDFEDFYCPKIEWDWGDGTVSEASGGCEPFVAGESEISRFMSKQRVFREPGEYRVRLTFRKGGRTVAVASTTIQVHRGLGDPGY